MVLISTLEYIKNHLKVDWVFTKIFLINCSKSTFIDILGYSKSFYQCLKNNKKK